MKFKNSNSENGKSDILLFFFSIIQNYILNKKINKFGGNHNMNSEPEHNENAKLEEEITLKIQPYLEKIKSLEDSLSQKEEDIVILKYAYNRIVEEVETLNKAKKK